MFFKNGDFGDYQFSVRYLEKRKKRFPESHLFFLYQLECGKIRKTQTLSCYEQIQLWKKFKAEHESSNVASGSLLKEPSKDIDTTPKSSQEIIPPELSLENVKIK